MSLTDPILVPVRLDVDAVVRDAKAMGDRITAKPVKGVIEYSSDISPVVKDIKALLAKEYAIKWRFDLDMRAATTAISEFKTKAGKIETQLFVNTASAVRELATFRSNNAALNVSVTAKDLQVTTDTGKAGTALAKLFTDYGTLAIKTTQDMTAVKTAMTAYRTESKAMVLKVEANTAQAVADLDSLKAKHGTLKVAVEAKDLEVKTDMVKAKDALERLFNAHRILTIKTAIDLSEIKTKLSAYRTEYGKMTIAVGADTSKAVNQIVAFRNTAKVHVIKVGADTTDAATRLAKLRADGKTLGSTIGIDTAGASKKLQVLTDRFDTLGVKIKADVLSAKATLSQLFADFKALPIVAKLDQVGARRGVDVLFEKYKKLPIAVSLDAASAIGAIKKMASDFKDLASHLTMDTRVVAAKLTALFDKFDQLDIKPKADLKLIRQSMGALFGDYKTLTSVVKIDHEAATKTLTALREKFDRLLIIVAVDAKTAQTTLSDFRARFKTLAVAIDIDGSKAEKSIRALFTKFEDLTVKVKADVTAARATLTALFKSFGKLAINTTADTERAGGSLAAVHRKYKTLKLDVTADPAKVAERLEALSGRAGSLKLKADLDVTAAAAKIDKLDAQTNKINASILLDDDQARAKIFKLVSSAKSIDARVDLDTSVAKARIAKLGAQTNKIEIETELKKPNMDFLRGLGSMAANLFQSGFQIVTNLIQGSLAGIGAFLKESLKVGNEVDAIVRRGSGLAGGGEDAYQKIRENAIRVGAQPNYLVSTKDIAQSTEIYLKAGQNLDQAIAAQTGIAEISTMTGEKATAIANNLLDFQSKFSLNASEQKKSAELFAGLLTSAKLNSKDIANSAKYITPDGNTIKDLENTTKQLALMAKSGIRGMTAATSMSAALRNLPKIMDTIGVSRTTVDGRVKSQLELMIESRKALLEYQRINGKIKTTDLVLNAKDGFGVNGGRAMLQFMQQSDEAVSSTLAKIDNAAAKMKIISAESLKSTAVGGIAVKNSVETLQVRLAGALAPAVNAMQLGVSNVLNGLTNSPIWPKVAALTGSIAQSINSPVLQAALGKVGELLSVGILKGVQGIETMFRLLASPPDMPWLRDLSEGINKIFGGAFNFITTFGKSLLGAGFLDAFMSAFKALSGAVGETFNQLGKVVESVFKTEGAKEFFTGIGDAARGAGALILPLIKMVGTAVQILAPSIGTVLGLVGKSLSLAGNLALVVAPIMSGIQKGIAIGIAPALKGVLYVLTNIIASPLSLVVNGLTIVKDVIWLVAAGFDKSKEAVYQFADRTNARLNAVYRNIGTYFSNIGKWVVKATGDTWKAFDGLGKSVAQIYAATFSGIGKGLTSLNSLVGSVLVGIGQGAVNLFRSTMANFDGMGRSIALIYKGMYDSARGVLSGIVQLGAWVVKSSIGQFSGMAASIGSSFRAIGPAVQSVSTYLVGLAKWAVDSIKAYYAGIGAVIGGAFNAAGSVAKNAMTYLVNIAKWAVTSIRSVFSGVGAAIGGAFGGAYNGARSAFQNVVNIATWAVNSVRNVFSGIGNTIANAFAGVSGAIQRAFSPISSLVNSVRNSMDGLVNSARSAANSVASIRMPSFSLPKFAAGGVIGQGRSTVDDQLILAQRGEGVITHKGMDVLGADRLALLNAGIQAFALGGVVGGTAKPTGSGKFDVTLDFSRAIGDLVSAIRPMIGSLVSAIKTGGGNLIQSIAPLTKSVTSVITAKGITTAPAYPTSTVKPLAAGMAKATPGASAIDLAAVFKGSNWAPAGKQLQGPNESIFEAAGYTASLIRTLKAFEQYSGTKYRDSEGIDTIGFGSARTSGDPAVLAALAKGRVSVAEANTLMLNHLKKENPIGYIKKRFPSIKSFTEGQIAALVSMYYNGGPGLIDSLARKAQTIPQIAAAIPTHWINSGTASEVGLRNRRAVETKLFNAVSKVTAGTVPTIAGTSGTVPGAVDRLKVAGVSPSSTFVRVSRTGQKDKAGLEILRTDLIKGGLVVDSMFATSGQPYIQKFQAAGQRGQAGAGSMAPMPEGIFKLGAVDKTSGSFGNGLGNTYIPIEGNFGAGRSAIGIHRDANITVSPGSAGCVVFSNQKDIDKMASWVTSAGAKTIVTDWGLGTVKTTGTGKATITPNKAIVNGMVQSVVGTAPNIVAGVMNTLAPPILDSITGGLNLEGAALASPILQDMAGSVADFAGGTDTLTSAAEDMAKGVGSLAEELPKIMRYGAILKDATDLGTGNGRVLPERDPATGRFIAKSTEVSSTYAAPRPSVSTPPVSPVSSLAAFTPTPTLNSAVAGRPTGRRTPFEFRLTLTGGSSDYGANQSGGDRTYDGIRSITSQVESHLNSEGFQGDLIDRLIEALRGDDRLRLQGGI